MSLTTPIQVEKLQTALHAKAKAAPAYRFYALYDKVYRADILAHAYQRCHANQGAAGVDGENFQDIEAHGVEAWLAALTQELKDGTYQPSPVKRVWMAKPDGSQRPLGIPTIRDRVVQMAVALVLGPIFEADLPPEQYAYRPEKSAQDAAMRVRELIRTGYTDVVDADLSGYFDSIPHHELMKCVARRVCDPHVLHLIKMWLEAPVEEIDEHGRKLRTTRNKDKGRGTAQGSPLSPLLANLYMRRFLVGFKVLGHAERLKAYIINYADDFVICTQGRGAEALAAMHDMMAKLKLTVNDRKTRRCHLPEEKFTFLSYTFGRYYSRRTGGAYLGLRPSRKKVRRLCRTVSELTDRRTCWQSVTDKVAQLNRKLRGWASYFSLGTVIPAYEAVMGHARRRLRRWLCYKHKVRTRKYARYPKAYLHDELHLVDLGALPRSPLWANA